MRIESGGGWIDLDRPRTPDALLVLTHGAGGGVETPDLLAIRTRALDTNVAIALITQPYRVAGRSTPPRPPAQDAAWLATLSALRRRRSVASLPLLVGGRSNGARVACRTAHALNAIGVVALAFPLHPPGRPENSRLPELELPHVPVLVVQGDRDPFGLPPQAHGRTVHVVPGADHSLRKQVAATAATVVGFVTSLTGRASVRG